MATPNTTTQVNLGMLLDRIETILRSNGISEGVIYKAKQDLTSAIRNRNTEAFFSAYPTLAEDDELNRSVSAFSGQIETPPETEEAEAVGEAGGGEEEEEQNQTQEGQDRSPRESNRESRPAEQPAPEPGSREEAERIAKQREEDIKAYNRQRAETRFQTQRNRQARARAAETASELQRGRTVWEGQAGRVKMGVDLKKWYSTHKKDYIRRKQNFYRGIVRGIGTVAAGVGIGVAEGAGKLAGKAGRAAKAGAAKVGRSIATTRPVQWAGRTRLGQWTKKLPKRVKSGLSTIDNNISDYIGKKLDREVVYKQFMPRKKAFRGKGFLKTVNRIDLKKEFDKKKKKAKSKTMLRMGLAGRAYIGRILNQVRNAIRVVRDGAYTYSGLKSLNNGRKALGKALTNTKARFMGGAFGKGLIRAQQAANGVRALGRATGTGLRYGAIGAGLALAMGGGSQAILAAAALSGGTGMLVKLTTDTLSSTKISPLNAVARFQQRYGVLGQDIKMQGLQGPSPAIIKTRVYTLAKSLNTGFYGFAAGTLVATLLGASPALALAIGAGTAAGATAARYAAGRVSVNAAAKIATNANLLALSKLPFFELVGIATATPWISSQIAAMRSQGVDYFAKNWSPGNLKSWLNYLKGAELGFNVFSTSKALSSIATTLGPGGAAVLVGTAAGTAAGVLILAPVLGIPFGTGMIIGGVVGGIAGGIIGGVFGGPIGAVVVSTITSTLGSWIGSLYDKFFGQVNILQNMLSFLSLAKTLLDFVNALTKKFDPTAALGLALGLMFMGAALVDLGFDEMNTNRTTQPIQSRTRQAVEGAVDSKVKGESIEIVTIDCKEDLDGKVYNPNTSIVTKITKASNGTFEIQTKLNVFKNISDPEYIVRDSTLSKGELVGKCYF